MGKYFGTDGFRGEAGITLTAEHAYRIGRFLGGYSECTHGVVVGKDTRKSGAMLEYAIAAGLAASGANAFMMRVTTTPSISFATAVGGFDFGVMVSASHNPFYDNGIKIVNRYGEKIDDKMIEDIEAYIDGRAEEIPYARGAYVGEIDEYYEGRDRYIEFLSSVSECSFENYKVGLDLANGSASLIAKKVFDALGAQASVINGDPDGININVNSGSTHIEALREHVIRQGLDVGFAFDGDADRCIAVDENGRVVNGDHILYILANDMKKRGTLKKNTVVTTVMSNLGLYRAFDEAGIGYEKSDVGDRFVYENMQKNGYSLGGEQSGHIIMSEYAKTGDGILTAIKLMEAMKNSKKSLADMAKPVKMLPQVTVNVNVTDKIAVRRNPNVQSAVKEIESSLGNFGRILLRESGTEPVVRIMVEAERTSACRAHCETVAAIIRAEGLVDNG